MPVAFSRTAVTMMLGAVPISVTSPPRIEPNDSGIRITAGERLILVADWSTAGIKRASAPTLFIIADNPPAMPARLAAWPEAERIGGNK